MGSLLGVFLEFLADCLVLFGGILLTQFFQEFPKFLKYFTNFQSVFLICATHHVSVLPSQTVEDHSYTALAKIWVGGSRKLLVLLILSTVFILILTPLIGGWVRKSPKLC